LNTGRTERRLACAPAQRFSFTCRVTFANTRPGER
jgi:hypothetical protein